MINKKRYTEILSQFLNEHYNKIKKKDSPSNDRQQFVDGYLTAARALDVFDYDELKKIIDDIHFNTFGETIDKRRKSVLNNYSLNEKMLAIPTFIRDGILLEKNNIGK